MRPRKHLSLCHIYFFWPATETTEHENIQYTYLKLMTTCTHLHGSYFFILDQVHFLCQCCSIKRITLTSRVSRDSWSFIHRHSSCIMGHISAMI
ncbi:hypothetical protein F7725_006778 [Dissostichus mawsoni]|uniref:Uncharacterized protein n=1 Tax=Dissostichus mawsoni TaxID=36200 RepID=A0A7J5XUV2_DISMA|nr:hypothetical protein F7725_006778 [Dissostichus mawsoni]